MNTIQKLIFFIHESMTMGGLKTPKIHMTSFANSPLKAFIGTRVNAAFMTRINGIIIHANTLIISTFISTTKEIIGGFN
jgi:hypothetical protein